MTSPDHIGDANKKVDRRKISSPMSDDMYTPWGLWSQMTLTERDQFVSWWEGNRREEKGK